MVFPLQRMLSNIDSFRSSAWLPRRNSELCERNGKRDRGARSEKAHITLMQFNSTSRFLLYRTRANVHDQKNESPFNSSWHDVRFWFLVHQNRLIRNPLRIYIHPTDLTPAPIATQETYGGTLTQATPLLVLPALALSRLILLSSFFLRKSQQ